MDRPLHQPRGALPPGGLQALDLGVDLLRALGEPSDQLGGHALELAIAPPVRRRPLDPERAGQPVLVGRPVDGVGRAAVAV
jgi:hypothetical protein